eukprot:CAMPEP_0170606576 /NCGR_PEP_ID=MMETSP0224-20130122/20587_1 /TAXON_ID=285029 /ORGANISM="Togula jolla, Strain CCCM 725" /LENGTH=485 /DNA_ID=CAMNT_0010931669 /DNA_START=56 /DNA_END=1513 /DNA_ORIENTATION=-
MADPRTYQAVAGSQGPNSKFFPLFIIGHFCFSVSLFITVIEEKQAVCKLEPGYTLTESATDLNCFDSSVAADGDAVGPGDLGFLSCNLDQGSFRQFNETTFSGLGSVFNLFGGSVPAIAMTMQVRIVVCKETCRESECSYGLQWSDSMGEVAFRSPSKALMECGGGNAHTQLPVLVGTHDEHAAGGQVTTEGGVWSLSNMQVHRVPAEYPVTLSDGNATFVQSSIQPPNSIDRSNTKVLESSRLVTCDPASEVLGCLEMTFKKASPSSFRALGQLSEYGQFGDSFTIPQGSFEQHLCGAHHEMSLVMCPGSGDDEASNAKESCSSSATRDDLLNLAWSSSSWEVWLARLCLLAAACAGLTMVLASIGPLSAGLGQMQEQLIENPQVMQGSRVSPEELRALRARLKLEDSMAQGRIISHRPLCIIPIALVCGASCWLIVASLPWLMVRLWYSLALIFIGLCFCCCTCCLCHRRTSPDGEEESSEEA